MMMHPSIDTVVSEVNKEVMDGIRRTVDPLVHLVKDAHKKYGILEQVLQGMPLFAELHAERDRLRAQLDKHETNIVMTVQDTTSPRVEPVPPEEGNVVGLAQFLQSSIAAEGSTEAQRALRSVLTFIDSDSDGPPHADTRMHLSPYTGSEDDGLRIFNAYTLGSEQSMDAISRSVAKEVGSHESAFAALMRSEAATGCASSTRSLTPTSVTANATEADLSQEEESAGDLSQEEESAGDTDLIPYDGLVDEDDNPIECFADDPENGTLYEKVGHTYEEIGQLHNGEVSFNE